MMLSKSLMITGSVCLSMLSTLPAPGQPKPPVDQPSRVDPKACAPGERLTQDPQTKRPVTPGGGENLSEKLSRDEGVLCPPIWTRTSRFRRPTWEIPRLSRHRAAPAATPMYAQNDLWLLTAKMQDNLRADVYECAQCVRSCAFRS